MKSNIVRNAKDSHGKVIQLSARRRPLVFPEHLNTEQKLAFQCAMRRQQTLLLLLGGAGTGKSHTINAIVNGLTQAAGGQEDTVMVTATTGRAAFIIGGSTIHSWDKGLCLPCGRMQRSALKGNSLVEFQDRMACVTHIIIDEMSMLSLSDLFMINERCKQARPDCKDQLLGGFSVILCGDPAQLPPVRGLCLWNKDKRNQENMQASFLWENFITVTPNSLGVVVYLQENFRQGNPEQRQYRELLSMIRNGVARQSDWEWLSQRTSISMG